MRESGLTSESYGSETEQHWALRHPAAHHHECSLAVVRDAGFHPKSEVEGVEPAARLRHSLANPLQGHMSGTEAFLSHRGRARHRRRVDDYLCCAARLATRSARADLTPRRNGARGGGADTGGRLPVHLQLRALPSVPSRCDGYVRVRRRIGRRGVNLRPAILGGRPCPVCARGNSP